MLFAGLFVAVVLSGIGHYSLKKNHPEPYSFFLQYFFVYLGLSGLMGFFGHVFLSDQVALSIGWPAGSPFQFEVGISNLALSVLGFLSLKIKGSFILAALIANWIFGWGAAVGHLRQMYLFHNFASGNSGAVFYFDLLIPLVMWLLYWKAKPQKRN
ncbi:MAG: DUF6790 family protein [Parachlamydiales bacterium]